MKKFTTKSTALFILLILSISILCSCNDDVSTATTDEAVPFVINVDGKNITVENPAVQTIEQILKKANIKLNDGDIVSVDTDSVISEGIIVNILRKCEVTVKDEINNTECTVVLIGATVKEAISAAGVELPENYSLNHKLNTALENKMEIIISEKEEPETTTEEADEDSNSGNQHYTPSITKPSATKPATTTKPTTTTPPTTKPSAPTTSGRTVVSVEVYEDCDGSGHGVKVITYSDGTQEEVPF